MAYTEAYLLAKEYIESHTDESMTAEEKFRRCYHILATLPGLLLAERKRKRNKQITGQCGRRHSPVFRQNIVNNNNHQN